MKTMKTIGFLFGAGAEGKGQFDMSSGAAFKTNILKNKNVQGVYEMINPKEETVDNKEKSAKKTIYTIETGSMLRAHKSSVLYQTLAENKDKNIIRYIEILIGESNDYKIKKTIEDYVAWKSKSNNSDTEKVKKFQENFAEIYKKLHTILFVDESCNECCYLQECGYNRCRDKLVEYISFYSYVDSIFNYLRKPTMYPKEVAKVMQIYFAAYITIANDILDKKDTKGKTIPLEKTGLTRDNIIDKLTEKQKNRIKNNKNISLYYKIIKEFKDKHKHKDIDLKFVTTNYTIFAEEILFEGESQKKETHFTYLHGRMDLFESVEKKEIKKLSDFRGDETIFPYLLIQSGVKPIINKYQIEQFHNGFKTIYDCDCLVVLGYGYNSDDDHIASVIRERIAMGKKIYWFLYEKEQLPDELTKIEKIEKNEENKTFISKNCLELEDTLKDIYEKIMAKSE